MKLVQWITKIKNNEGIAHVYIKLILKNLNLYHNT